MNPLYLRISGFLSYQDLVELDFSTFNLACISGANGAGKSSLLDAITWALFGEARRHDDTLINSHSPAAEVVFDFEYEGNQYRVQRSKQTGKATILEFYTRDSVGIWRPRTEHTMRDTEQSIRNTLKMDYETFTNASFFLQGKADQFSQQRPGDRKRVLSNILRLDVWETYRERAGSLRKQKENDLAVIDDRIGEIDSELNQEDERRKNLAMLTDNLARLTELRQAKENELKNLRWLAASVAEQKRLVDMLAGQVQVAEQRLIQRKRELQSRQDDRETYRQRIQSAVEIEAAYQRWLQARRELEKWEIVAADFREYDAKRAEPLQEIASERSRLEQEQRTLLVQQDRVEFQAGQLEELERQIFDAQAALQQAVERSALRANLETARVELQKISNELLAENKRLKEQMKELNEDRIQRLELTSGAECPLCGQPLSPEDRDRLLEDLYGQGKDMGDRFRANLEAIRQNKEELQRLEIEIEGLQDTENILRQSQRNCDQLTDRKHQVEDLIADWQAGGAKQLGEVRQILADSAFAFEARQRLAEIDSALRNLGYNAAAHDEVRLAEHNGRTSEARLRELENARAALEPLEREITSLQKQITTDQEDLGKLDAGYQQASLKYAADMAALPDSILAENDYFKVREDENRMLREVGSASQKVDILIILRARKEDLVSRREEVTSQIGRLKTLEKAFGKDGVPALLIEQALPEIETQANEILDRLTAGGMSVRFATQKEYKDKNREDKRETLDILISDSAGVRDYELFSGGEAFRVNFAIRLALSRVLAQRNGARLRSLVIDEGFGSQDAEGRQRLIEAINLVRPDFDKVLVITHLEELKDAFPARIEVEKTAHGSTVKVIV